MLFLVVLNAYSMPTQNISLGEYVRNVERSVRLSGDRVATWMFYVSTIKHY